MADEEDKSSKTEEPTEHKLRKAREQGNVPKSKEVNTLFMLIGMLVVMVATLPFVWEEILAIFGTVISESALQQMNSTEAIGSAMSEITYKMMLIMLPTFAILFALAYVSTFVQTGFILSAEPIKPKASKISLIKGLERMFGVKALMEFLKALIKMVVLGAVLYFVLYLHIEDFLLLNDKTPMALVETVEIVTIRMLIAAIVIAFFISIVDFIFQKAQHIKENRMSRKEMKDEFKENDGDPHIKSRQRQIRLERARARMMQELPSADVVVTNPTHYAVALRYDKEKEAAPRCIAKGVDAVALRIRERATEAGVELYEDPPLARQLYAETEVGEEIPLELYEAVATVVAYIYNKDNKKRAQHVN